MYKAKVNDKKKQVKKYECLLIQKLMKKKSQIERKCK